jgi:hypothetical protein
MHRERHYDQAWLRRNRAGAPYATHAVRFYVESGDSLQFLVNTVGGGGEATCWISGYFLDT